MQSEISIPVNVDMEKLDEAIEKVEKLVVLLREANGLLNILLADNKDKELAFVQACVVMKVANTSDGAAYKNSSKGAIDRFNTDKQNFICTEALKIFCQTKDDDTALRALELLTEAAQPF